MRKMKLWTECVPIESDFLARFRKEFKDDSYALGLLDLEYGYREIEDAINNSLPNTEYTDDKSELVEVLETCDLDAVIADLKKDIRRTELLELWEKLEDDITEAVEVLGD
jgi:hypothetical protein